MKRILLTAASFVLAGCVGTGSKTPPVVIITDMDYQGRYEPQGDRTFNGEKPIFDDARASRRPVEDTVARGSLVDNDSFSTGLENNMYIGRNPLKVDADLLKHGQRRFNTYCTPCHDRTGQGRGIVGQRATWIPTNLQEPRVKEMNDGEIFNVMTFGRRSMPSYRFQVVDHDRWAIVAYVRALQRTSIATVADVPEDKRSELK
jgi:cytochrome c5